MIIERFMNTSHHNRSGVYWSDSAMRWLWSTIVSIFCIGGMVGGVTAGYFANHFGRKGAMLSNNIIAIAACLLMGLSKVAQSYEMLIVGRFIVGVSSGISTGLAPLYLSEIAPISLRGAAGTLNQFAIVCAVLVSQILGLKYLMGTEELWPYLIGFGVVPALLQLITLPFCPESPRYLLITKEDPGAARKALTFLRSSSDVSDEIMEMQTEFETSKGEPQVSLRDLYCNPNFRQPFLISVGLNFSIQLTGINGVVFYSTALFNSTGLSWEEAGFGTLGVAGINVIMTFVSVILMDKAGRRTLHLYGLGGMWVFSMLITVALLVKEAWHPMAYFAIVFTIMFVVFFAIGPGAIPWLIVSELFPQGPRGRAMSIAVLSNWFGAFIIAFGFPSLQEALQSYTFIPFSILLALFWIFTYWKVPETKNRTIMEISNIFRRDVVNRADYERFQVD